MSRRRWLTVLVGAAALLLVVGRFVAGLVVDYQWYVALGASQVWWTRTNYLLALRGAAGLVATGFLLLNLFAVRQSVVSLVLPRRIGNLEIGEEVPPRYLLAAAAVLSAILGFVLALALDDWQSLVLVRDGVLFQESDPYYQFDLGFFVYWLPFESALRYWSLLVLVVTCTAVVLLYALTPSLRWERGTLRVSGYVRRHLTVLGAVLLLLFAWNYRLDAYTLLIDGSGDGGIFTAVDHRVGIPVYLLLAFLTATAALLVLWAGWTGQIRIAFGTVTAVIVLSLGLRQLLPAVATHLLSPADPVVRERPYAATRAGYTRRAFGVDRIVRDDSTYGFASLRDAALATSLWDPPALTRAVERASRQGEVSGAVGWGSDSMRLVARVTERPVGPEGADPQAPWLATEVVAAMTDERGGPLPTRHTPGPPDQLPPAIVSDGATGYLIVADHAGNVAAADISGWWTRLAHAWDQQNLRILFADLPRPTPRIILRRDVRERVRDVMPFFGQGREITPLIRGDTLYWSLHLYASSDWYPLSYQVHNGDNAMRYLYHAGVALVNAGTGRVLAVADSSLDPIATTWRRHFPELFTSRESLSPLLLAQISPAIDGAIAQAAAFGRTGLRGETTIVSHLPATTGADSLFSGSETAMFASPRTGGPAWATVILDPGDHVRGLLVAEGGDASETRWLPFAGPGPRWPSLVERLQRAPDSASAVPGARLVRGKVRAVPMAGGAIFVQTTYAWRAEGPPTVTRIAMLRGDSISVGRSLAEIAGVEVESARSIHAPATVSEFRDQASQLYSAMREAQRRGDWAAFGQAYDALGRLLRAPAREAAPGRASASPHPRPR